MDSFYPSDEEFYEGKYDNWIGYLHRIHWPESSENNSDIVLHNRIQDELYRSPDVDASKVLVTVMNGHVSLSGEVRTVHEIEAAERVVSNLDNVWAVENFITTINQ